MSPRDLTAANTLAIKVRKLSIGDLTVRCRPHIL